MKLLATGDLHLTERSRLGPEWLDRQQEVWTQIVKMAIERDVDALLFAGDAFEHRHPTPREILAFKAPLAMLHCPVIAVAGNHDVVNQGYPTALEVCLGSMVARAPRVIGDIGCLPWTPLRRLVPSRGSGESRDELSHEAAELLVRAAADLREYADILMLHWSVSGFSLPNGLPVDQLREPVLDLDELHAQGWEWIVQGHIHRSSRVQQAFYVGSPICLNHGEENVDHGCWIIYGDAVAEFIPLDGPRFLTLEPGEEPPEDEDVIYRYREVREERTISRAPGLTEDVDAIDAARLYCAAQEISENPLVPRTAEYLEAEWVGR